MFGSALSVSGGISIALLVLVAVAMLAWLIAQPWAAPKSGLEEALSQYAGLEDVEDIDERIGVKIVSTDFVRRAVESASRLGPGRTVVTWLERKLDQANVPLRAAEALFAYSSGVILAAVLALVLVGPVTALGLGGGLCALPIAVLANRARRRKSKFTHQLPDALKLLSGTLRAGFSLIQGVETIAGEVGDPMGTELQRVLAEARLGRPLDDALADMASRLESPDFEWTVMAIGIQREVGGNLAELLDTVAETMQARQRLRGEVRALTAEGKISAIVIGILPVGLAFFMWLVNRDYISVLFESTLGQGIAVGSLVLAVFGFWWMKKTIEIEV
jgi:tight adherence protein B